jgi:glutathione S-transferase
VLYRYFDIDIDRRDLPDLAGYYQRLSRRIPYQQAVMVSYDELRVTA